MHTNVAANTPKTVLLVGAGLSAASAHQLPTMRGFFEPALASRHGLQTFLEWFYPDRNISDYNLEEVMSFLHLSNVRIPLWRNGRRSDSSFDCQVLYDDLLEYVKIRLSTGPESGCSLHERLFQTLGSRDSIISFNYDLVADKALLAVEPRQNDRPMQDTRMGKLSGLLGRLNLWSDPPPSLMPREQEWGFYLKLHGSLDWLYCDTQGCENNVNLFACSVAELAEGQLEGMPCRYCGAGLKIFIVPPIATKRLEDRGRMAFLWNLALRELSSTNRITVIGLSFAPSDFELRWLVRQAVELRVDSSYELHVVNPTPSHRNDVIAVFPGANRMVYEYATVLDYIEERSVSTT